MINKNIVSVRDGMCGNTPWSNMPISFFVLPIQYYFSGTTMRWQYSSEAPVFVSLQLRTACELTTMYIVSLQLRTA